MLERIHLAALALVGLVVASCGNEKPPGESGRTDVLSNVGTAVCESCHAEQTRQWSASHHALAMQPAGVDTVLGDFSNVEFEYFDTVSTFFTKDNQYFVRTQNAVGELQDFQIKYTFGVTPLQQYLIEMPGGHVQALSIVWDDRSAAAGGQRWYHLYPDEFIAHDDELHWTGRAQNWNYMCAECHSTNLQKNYTLANDSFATHWDEISVGCEACHGPGSRHVEQATNETPVGGGLVVSLDDAGHAVWEMNTSSGIAERSEFRARPPTQPESCGRCHSRRSSIVDRYEFGRPLLDTHSVSLLDEDIYFPDGQIEGEVYVYGSFLQSRMYQAGVSCSDCHDPHSAKLKTSGGPSDVCSTCHLPDVFAASSHHQHEPASVSCVDCHMTSRTYMGVDGRRDHSFRVPRPDLTATTGAPNACNNCHDDESAEWASLAVVQWYGQDRNSHFGSAIHAAQIGEIRANEQLNRFIVDNRVSGIARGTALSLLRGPYSPEVAEVIRDSIASPDAFVRIGAIRALGALQPELRAEWGGPRLSDPLRAVRLEALRVLSPVRSILHLQHGAAFRAAEDELLDSLNANRELPASHVNLGNHFVTAGDLAQAEAAYQTALRLERRSVGARVNMADLYRQQARDDDAEELIRAGLDLAQDDANLHHALGLLLVRLDQPDEALRELALAAELQPDNPRFAFVYGVALNSTGEADRALQILTTAAGRFPADFDIHWGLATMLRDLGRNQEATDIAAQMVERFPGNSSVVNLLQSLR